MKQFYYYEAHDYMDLKPMGSFCLCASQEEADQFISHMRTNWCSGTVSDARPLSKQEFIDLLTNHDWPMNEIQEWLDKAEYEI